MGREESQHGRALGRWAEMADPNFKLEEPSPVSARAIPRPISTRRSDTVPYAVAAAAR